MAPLSGPLISVWGIVLWGAVGALSPASFAAASAFSTAYKNKTYNPFSAKLIFGREKKKKKKKCF